MVVIKFQLGYEIRRISMERVPNLESLVSVATQLFHDALPQAISFTYKDDEGDIITVTTERELEEAFRLMKDGIMRFNIVEGKISTNSGSAATTNNNSTIPSDFVVLLESAIKEMTSIPDQLPQLLSSLLQGHPPTNVSISTNYGNGSNNTNNGSGASGTSSSEEPTIIVDIALDEKPVHPATCDNCCQRIRGIRYKCQDCSDYDLCENCEPNKAGIHSQLHSFSKIARPMKVSCPKAPQAPVPSQPEEQKPVGSPHPPKEPQQPQPQPEPEKPTVQPTVEPVVVKEIPAPHQTLPQPALPQPALPQPVPVQVLLPTPPTPVVTVPEQPKLVPVLPIVPSPQLKPEPSKPSSPGRFDNALSQLQEMGFTDNSRNLSLLVQYNGNLVEVVKKLLDG